MKTPFTYIVFVILALFTFNGKSQQALSYLVYENDTINVIDRDSLKQGVWKEFWSNGDLKSEVIYKNNKKQGLEIKWFDTPDCVEQESYYKDGVLDGPSVYYSKKCKKDFFETFKSGIKEGLELSYYPNGNIKAEGYYKKGNLNGYYRVYNKKESLNLKAAAQKVKRIYNPILLILLTMWYLIYLNATLH